MNHTIKECRAKDPRTCPYHGSEANLTQALNKQDIEAYLIAKEQLLPTGIINLKLNQNTPEFIRTITEPKYDWNTAEGKYSPTVQQKLQHIRQLMNIHGINHWSLMAYPNNPHDPITKGHISMSGHATEYGQRPILAFNEKFLENANPHAIEQMAYHEIAHALLPVYNEQGIKHLHGKKWQEQAKRLGFNFTSVTAGQFQSLDYRNH